MIAFNYPPKPFQHFGRVKVPRNKPLGFVHGVNGHHKVRQLQIIAVLFSMSFHACNDTSVSKDSSDVLPIVMVDSCNISRVALQSSKSTLMPLQN